MKKALILMLVVLSIFSFASCKKDPPHVHSFSTTWSSDENYHWHGSTCGHDVTSDNALHSWNSGTITKEPTHTATGLKTFTCTVCGAKRTDTIPANADDHSFSTAWSSDATYHWHASTCGHTTLKSEQSAHTWNDGVVTKSPTHTETGVKTFTCTVCGQTKTETIPALSDAHTFSAEWSFDANKHWHAATCPHTTLKSEESEHTWNDGVVTTPATCTEAGVKTYTCTVCGKTRTESIPAIGHAYDSGVITTPACTTTGVKTFTCGNCGDTYTEDIPAAGHSYSSDWSSDASYHWHAATCEHTTEKGSYEAHSFPVNATAILQDDGTYQFGYICTTCGYTTLVSNATVGDIGPAGGIVFYDKGEYSEGWRYLEAAPADLRVVYGTPSVDSTLPGYSSGTYQFIFGYYRTSSDGSNLYVNGTTTYSTTDCTVEAFGAGKDNTDLLVAVMGVNTYSESTGAKKTAQYAAKLCADLEYNGFDDWFLPSKDELNEMYKNKSIIGGFANHYYWSSSEYDYNASNAWKQFFDYGNQTSYSYRHYDDRVRPVRAF